MRGGGGVVSWNSVVILGEHWNIRQHLKVQKKWSLSTCYHSTLLLCAGVLEPDGDAPHKHWFVARLCQGVMVLWPCPGNKGSLFSSSCAWPTALLSDGVWTPQVRALGPGAVSPWSGPAPALDLFPPSCRTRLWESNVGKFILMSESHVPLALTIPAGVTCVFVPKHST